MRAWSTDGDSGGEASGPSSSSSSSSSSASKSSSSSSSKAVVFILCELAVLALSGWIAMSVLQPPMAAGDVRFETVELGASFTLHLETAGWPPPAHQWRRNGIDIPGQATADLRLASAGPEHAGTYTCVVENFVGRIVWSEAVLSIGAAAVVEEDDDPAPLLPAPAPPLPAKAQQLYGALRDVTDDPEQLGALLRHLDGLVAERRGDDARRLVRHALSMAYDAGAAGGGVDEVLSKHVIEHMTTFLEPAGWSFLPPLEVIEGEDT